MREEVLRRYRGTVRKALLSPHYFRDLGGRRPIVCCVCLCVGLLRLSQMEACCRQTSRSLGCWLVPSRCLPRCYAGKSMVSDVWHSMLGRNASCPLHKVVCLHTSRNQDDLLLCWRLALLPFFAIWPFSDRERPSRTLRFTTRNKRKMSDPCP
jgi:hypothetical protein